MRPARCFPMLAALLLTCGVAAQGCGFLLGAAAGGAAGAGAAAYEKGEYSVTYPAPTERTARATVAALDEMRLSPQAGPAGTAATTTPAPQPGTSPPAGTQAPGTTVQPGPGVQTAAPAGGPMTIRGKKPDGTPIDVTLEPAGPGTTRAKIRVGTLGDESLSQAIGRKITENLGTK